MSRLVRRLALFALVLGPLLARAGDDAPRARVAAVAQAIERHYFDPGRAARIAAELRAEAARGRYDALRDPRELASALTGRLQPLDRHFRVSWVPAASALPAPRAEPQLRRSRPEDHARRGNHGIRKVEVLPGNVGYLELREFAHFDFDDPDAPPRRAIEAALQVLAGVDALVIDLRRNGGGSPAMVGYLASAFLAPGVDVYNRFHSRDGVVGEAPKQAYPAPRPDLPLFVLTSARTGSAAEAFAYTLKHAGRATIVGEPSAGAANPGGEFDVGGGLRVFVSTGSPRNPVTGGNWEGDGVQPDVAVAQADAMRTATELALQAALARSHGEAASTETRWALEALRAQAAPASPPPLADYAGRYGPIAIETDDRGLRLRNRRRPALSLLQLQQDLFTATEEPSMRVRFERGARGEVTALETLYADGRSDRFRRDE
ncbi:S41 family peptidase [Vulcaniibacterium tengchongense]|uniref:Peptidase S41-like protein n=1 Tax=Vulcaniibacterium tengchongense TaxID=1273429 RepID=A0A3N4W756_9GAMM|nr:S41 family peptidase [Vulcaniibacterium tengchongense]RPE81920.1 peptidase S41-like protein [Vulcaniibacterium tengchongense]